MPFPLAHPAAVLPLRRYCPRFLSFPALVVGSLSPDAGYCLGPLNADNFSHSLLGSFIFCLPVSALMFCLLCWLRRPFVEILPYRLRKAFRPLCDRRPGPFLAILISLLAGIWSHDLLDSLTHKNGWLVEHWPLLQTQIGHIAHRRVKVCHLLWYGASFAGVAWLCLTYERWRLASDGATTRMSGMAQWGTALVVGLLVLPIEALHHLVRNPLGISLVAVLSLLLVAAVVLVVGNGGPLKTR
jgi:hypothetical protein